MSSDSDSEYYYNGGVSESNSSESISSLVSSKSTRPICIYYLKGACHFGFRCHNLHDSSKPKKLICSFYLKGNCRFGASCFFEHKQSIEERIEQPECFASLAAKYADTNSNTKSDINAAKILAINDKVSFGDLGNIFEKNSKTLREFVSGNYKAKICKSNVYIICEEHVDPMLILEFLDSSNHGKDRHHENYFDRYDWMMTDSQFSNIEGVYKEEDTEDEEDEEDEYEDEEEKDDEDEEEDDDEDVEEEDEDENEEKHDDEDEEEIEEDTKIKGEFVGRKFERYLRKNFEENYRNFAFFLNHAKLNQVKHSEIALVLEKNSRNFIYNIIDEGNSNEMIGYVIDCTLLMTLSAQGLRWGCVLVDKKTNQCFALVIEDAYDYDNDTRTGLNDIVADNYTYDMEKFYFKSLTTSEQIKRIGSSILNEMEHKSKKIKI